MRAAVITTPGAPDVLRIEERPLPAHGLHDLLVRVVAAGVNRADLVQRAGKYPAPPGVAPDIPGLEYAGVVAAVGDNVTGWRVGDRAFGLVPGAAHAEYVATDARTAMRVPDSLDLLTAGALPEACITAHDALRQARFVAGESVLLHAVGSGVGLAAVQVVRALSGTPYGTARSANKLDTARTLGLAGGVVPETGEDGAPRFADAVRALTDGRGVDVILDLVGGRYVGEGVRTLAPRGRLVLIGLLSGIESTIDLRLVLGKRLEVRGTVLRSRTLDERIAYTDDFVREVLPHLASGTIQASIEHTMPLDDIAAAHALLASNTVTGKIVLTIGE